MIMIGNFSDEWNNNSLINTNNFKLRQKEKNKLPLPALVEGKSFKDMLKIDEEESMIYGCEETIKKSGSSRSRLP
jgi:hypothetical protein